MKQAALPLTETKTAKKQKPASDLMKAVALKSPSKAKIRKDFSPEEAREIEQKLRDRKKAADEAEENRERREKIIKIKKLAKEMEKGNQSKVILFPSYSRKSDKLEWYKMGNFSALYYVYRMADRMGRSGKLRPDTDKFAKMHDGVVSIKGVEKFTNQAMRLEEFARSEETLDGMIILHMKSPLSDLEMGILRQSERKRREMMHNVLRPKKADAAVYQAILAIDRQLLPRTAKMPQGYCRVLGDDMARQIASLTEIYFEYADGNIGLDEMKHSILRLINGIRARTVLLGENTVWAYDVSAAVGENIEALKRLIKDLK